jgi:hypothetical protein
MGFLGFVCQDIHTLLLQRKVFLLFRHSVANVTLDFPHCSLLILSSFHHLSFLSVDKDIEKIGYDASKASPQYKHPSLKHIITVLRNAFSLPPENAGSTFLAVQHPGRCFKQNIRPVETCRSNNFSAHPYFHITHSSREYSQSEANAPSHDERSCGGNIIIQQAHASTQGSTCGGSACVILPWYCASILYIPLVIGCGVLGLWVGEMGVFDSLLGQIDYPLSHHVKSHIQLLRRSQLLLCRWLVTEAE